MHDNGVCDCRMAIRVITHCNFVSLYKSWKWVVRACNKALFSFEKVVCTKQLLMFVVSFSFSLPHSLSILSTQWKKSLIFFPAQKCVHDFTKWFSLATSVRIRVQCWFAPHDKYKMVTTTHYTCVCSHSVVVLRVLRKHDFSSYSKACLMFMHVATTSPPSSSTLYGHTHSSLLLWLAGCCTRVHTLCDNYQCVSFSERDIESLRRWLLQILSSS